MGQPAAKQGDRVVGSDIHIVVMPPPAAPAPLPHPFTGVIQGGCSTDVMICGKPAAVVGSVAVNTPSHIPTPPGIGFQNPPKNQATIRVGSQSVKINGKAAARTGDKASTCNDPADLPSGTVLAAGGTVMIG